MEKFNFYVDELKPQWWRYYVSVEAENQEEAMQKAVGFDCDILESEWLCDADENTVSIQVLDPKDYSLIYEKDV